MLTLLIFILVLSLLVFVHEFGHFFMAKRARMRVDEFGFGFPPRIVGIRRTTPHPSSSRRGNESISSPYRGGRSRDERAQSPGVRRGGSCEIVWGNPKNFDARAGDTLYSINALPFGGFVKIKGESGEEADAADSFASQGAGVRIGVIVAGVVMNALLAILLVTGSYAIGVSEIVEGKMVSQYARVMNERVEVLEIVPGSPADAAGIVPGDHLVFANNKAIQSADQFKELVAEFVEKPVVLQVSRDGRLREISVIPMLLNQTHKPGIGVAIARVALVRYPLWWAFPKGAQATWQIAKGMVINFSELIRDAVRGKPLTAELAGPVGIAVMTGAAARQGLGTLVQFMAILSVNLAVLNIIPFPGLDGGRILFILIEKVLRRPVARKVEGWIHGVGFALLLLLILTVTYHDLGRYGGAIGGFFRGIVGW